MSDVLKEPILVLTESMLRNVFVCEGPSVQHAEIMSRRVCVVLPDLSSLIQRIETRVMEQIMTDLAAEVENGVMDTLRRTEKRRAERIFGSVDEALATRLDKKARDKTRTSEEQEAIKMQRFSNLMSRANHSPPREHREDVSVVSPHTPTKRERDA